MAETWKRLSFCVAGSVSMALLSPAMSLADPINIGTVTVSFTLAGDNDRNTGGHIGDNPAVDPVYGQATASGFFSFSSRLIPSGGGFVQDFSRGVIGPGDGVIALSWAGTDWSLANAGVFVLQFDDTESLTGWGVGGLASGVGGVSSSVWPDIAIGSIISSPFAFLYTTPDSEQQGIFAGRLLSWTATTSAVAPTPEPMTLVLFGTGLLAVGVRRRWRCRPSSSTRGSHVFSSGCSHDPLPIPNAAAAVR